MTHNLPKNTKATVADLGPRLCIGHKTTELEIRDWSSQEELELGELAEEHKNASGWKLAELVVSTMTVNFGGVAFWRLDNGVYKPTMDAHQREVAMQGMYLADVLLAYLHIRIAALGHELEMQLKDPDDNGKPFDFVADLRSIEVTMPADRSDMTTEYKLIKPCQRNGKSITRFVLGPQRWASHTVYESSNPVKIKMDMVATSICAVPDLVEGPFQVDPKIMASFRVGKEDLSRMSSIVEDSAFGAELTVEAQSPKTGRRFIVPINWTYGNFFKASSR